MARMGVSKVAGLYAAHPSRCASQGRLPGFKRLRAVEQENPKGTKYLSVEEVQELASNRGLSLSVRTLGPSYRIVCRQGDEDGGILGYTNGFTIPFAAYMHCETLQVFSERVAKSSKESMKISALGLGVFLGVATFAFGHERGCQTAEILAINDDEYTSNRLIRYYSYFGFSKVKEVCSTDFLDLLIWGGVGTKMRADVQMMLERWGSALCKGGKQQ